jgi:NodT family efflux transporter outer membrane factor (OMF) lipoprotein
VGPDFNRPDAPKDTSYESTPLPESTPVADKGTLPTQHFSAGKDVPAEWWTLFRSKSLDALLTKAVAANPDLQAAEATLRQAQESEAAGDSVLFPSITGSFDTTRQKTSGQSYGGQFPGSLYTLHNASVSASYVLDVFGGSRRQIEELESQTDYQKFQLRAAYLTLTSNVVTAAIQEASLRGQIAETKKIIAAEVKQLDLVKQQLAFGGVTRLVVLQQENLVATSKATLPTLEHQLAQIRHQLSVYCGDTPSHDPDAKFELSSLELPTDLPVTIPSQLVEQRPDIRAAEANLHVASAAVGVAEANRLPQITLSANIGDVATNLGKMFYPGTGIWSAGFDISQSVFDAGQLEHEQGAAEAEFDAMAAQYRSIVLQAFQNVADALNALQADAEALNLTNVADRTATEELKLSEDRFKAGAISSLELLNSQVTAQQAHINRVKAEAQRYADSAALFQALGGGWWNAKIPGDVTTEEKSADIAPAATNTSDADINKPVASLQLWRHE